MYAKRLPIERMDVGCFYRACIRHFSSHANLGFGMSDVRIITTFPTSKNIFLHFTQCKEVYIGDEYR